MLSAAVSVQPVTAQRPPSPPDSAARDTSAADTLTTDTIRGSPHSLGMYLILPAGVVAFALLATVPAPAALLGPRGDNTMGFIQDRITLSTAFGGHFHDGQTWGSSFSLEVVRRAFLLELSREEYYGSRRARYATARIGYFFHPRQAVAGGLTIGYRDATDDARTGGFEIGLPLVGEKHGSTIRLEPTYVISPVGALWNYRFQWEFAIPKTRSFAGVTMSSRSRPIGGSSDYADDPDLASFGLVVGTSF